MSRSLQEGNEQKGMNGGPEPEKSFQRKFSGGNALSSVAGNLGAFGVEYIHFL